MVYLFWFGLASGLHSYFIYPLTLPLLSWFFSSRKSPSQSTLPKISVLIAVYNEEKVLRDKIKNCQEIDYPLDKIEFIFGSDGSTDSTDVILDTVQGREGFKVCKFSDRGGKSAVLNKISKEARGDILVFCDANTILLKNALKKLMSRFSGPSVGGVSGRLILNDSTGTGLSHGESLYWRLESEIKFLEGKMGVLLGANGALYAIRKSLYQNIPENKTVMDDFFITTEVLKRGLEVLYEPLAIGTEETSVDPRGEFNRKVRIGEANFNLFKDYLPLLNIRRPLVAYSFFSHKFLRWLGPLIFLGIFFSNMFLVFEPSSQLIYTLTFILQILFYGSAFVGYIFNKKQRKSSFLLEVPHYFVSMNIALFLGLIKSIFGKKKGSWDRIERSHTN